MALLAILTALVAVSYAGAGVLVATSLLAAGAIHLWRRRRRLFWVVAGVSALVLLAGSLASLLGSRGGGGTAPNPYGGGGAGRPPTPFRVMTVTVRPQGGALTDLEVVVTADLDPAPGAPVPPFLTPGTQTGIVKVSSSTVHPSGADGALVRTLALPGPLDLEAKVTGADGAARLVPLCYADCPNVHVVVRDFPAGSIQVAKGADATPLRRPALPGEEDVEWTQSTTVDEVRFSYRLGVAGSGAGGLLGALLGQVAKVEAPIWAVVGVALTTMFQRLLGDVYEILKSRSARHRHAEHLPVPG